MPDLTDFTSMEFSVARGEAAFPMTRGSFDYTDSVSSLEKLRIVAGSAGAAAALRAEKAIAATESVTTAALEYASGEAAGTMTARKLAEGKTLLSFHLSDTSWNRFYLTFKTAPEEHYYGCGETFSEFDLKGQRVRIWVAEHQNLRRLEKKMARLAAQNAAGSGVQPAGSAAQEDRIIDTAAGPEPEPATPALLPFEEYESYYAQPTFTSSGKWALHVRGTSFMAFDFTKEGQITLELWQDAEILLLEADNFTELSRKLSEELGTVPELPDWVFDGVIPGIQKGPEVIEEKLAACRAHGVPVAGIWCQDWCGCRRTGFGYQVMWNWEYDPALYPDLPARIAEWKAQGVRFLGYINPFLAIEKGLYREASAKGYCVKDREGKDYLVTITTFPAAMIDLSNPEAYEWYKEVIKKNMIGIGMGGWMADFGEYLPCDAVLYDGSDPMLAHNSWPARWAQLNREALEETGTLGEIFFFTRAGSAGTIRNSTMMWTGDQHVDWSMDDGPASVIPATLSLAMSGYGFAHSDFGGYTTTEFMTRSRELLMRWEEMNVFSPLMRGHEGNQPDRNVQFDADPELLDHLAHCARIHVHLKPYLKELIREEAASGTPVMRPLFYHYDEPSAYTEKYEYLLGRDLLVAPVVEKGAIDRQVYLPNDNWIHLFTGQKYNGGIVRVEAPIGQPPVFIRENSPYFDLLSGRK